MPVDFEDRDRFVESLEAETAVLPEHEALAHGQIVDGTRRQDRPGLGPTAQPRSKLDGGTEQIIALCHRLTRGEPDSDTSPAGSSDSA